MVVRKRTAETNKSSKGRLGGCALHAQKENKAGRIGPWHLFQLHTGVMMETTLEVTYNNGIQNCSVRENRCHRLGDAHEIPANSMGDLKRPFC